MNIEIPAKIHNKFDFEVRDIRSGEIKQKAKAENIILNTLWGMLGSTQDFSQYISYGSGTGTLSTNRTTLFTKIASLTPIIAETAYNVPPLASFCKKKAVIVAGTQIGKTITEVGYGDSTLYTHALIKDAEGNPLSVGPLSEFDEVTIYSTVFAEITLADGHYLLFHEDGSNAILGQMTGGKPGFNWGNNKIIGLTSTKNTTSYKKELGELTKAFDASTASSLKKITSGRIRFDSTNGNGKIWGICFEHYSSAYQLFAINFPNTTFSGYHFEGKSIGAGDGVKTKFILPWSDINNTKEYKFYKDGVLLTESTDYTLANSSSETSITFTTAPADTLPITGDWWVDYIPKDTSSILDITVTIQYAEGA